MKKITIPVTETTSLKEAQDALRIELKKGAICPCCNRLTKMYSRKITSAMAYGLILIYHEFQQEHPKMVWLHIENFFKAISGLPSSVRADIPKLRFWDLIQPDGEECEDGNPNTGMYKITEQGKLFVEGKILVNSHINVYNNKMYGFHAEATPVNITQALGSKFKYEELMKAPKIIFQ